MPEPLDPPPRSTDIVDPPGVPGAAIPHPRSVEEILAIACTMEREAATRYGDLASCMRLVGRADLADLFGELASEEQHHIAEVKELSQRILRRMPTLAVVVQWQLPETLGAENRTVVTNALTPYEALVTAVHNEERAFAFWTYVASEAEDEAIRRQAEMMARQELLHASALRVARRRAYHAGGRIRPPARPGEGDRAETLSALEARRRRLGLFLRHAAAHLRDRGDDMSGALLQFAAEEVALPPLPQDERRPGGDPLEVSAQGDAVALLFKATGQIELLSEAVLQCMEGYPDLATDGALPALAKSTALQLAILNRRLCELEPRLSALTSSGGTGKTSF